MTREWWKVVSQRKFWILFPKVNFGSLRTIGNGCWTETMGVYYRGFLTRFPLPHKKQTLVSVTGMCLRIIIRCHFRFILWLQQHYVFICWSIRLVSSDCPPFIAEIFPHGLSFVPINLKTIIFWVSAMCQGMLPAGDVAVDKGGRVAPLVGLSVSCSSFLIMLPCSYLPIMSCGPDSLTSLRPWLYPIPH